jgi:hypothetical protein
VPLAVAFAFKEEVLEGFTVSLREHSFERVRQQIEGKYGSERVFDNRGRAFCNRAPFMRETGFYSKEWLEPLPNKDQIITSLHALLLGHCPEDGPSKMESSWSLSIMKQAAGATEKNNLF